MKPNYDFFPKKILYKNATWLVTSYGLEHFKGTYSIAKKDLYRAEDAHSWHEHLAEKDWINLREFALAYRAALQHHFPGKFSRRVCELQEAAGDLVRTNPPPQPPHEPGYWMYMGSVPKWSRNKTLVCQVYSGEVPPGVEPPVCGKTGLEYTFCLEDMHYGKWDCCPDCAKQHGHFQFYTDDPVEYIDTYPIKRPRGRMDWG